MNKIVGNHIVHVVGISEMKAASSDEDEFITYSLGSCVGVTIYDPEVKAGGMIHCLLPMSKIDRQKAKDNPCMFVDTGVALLLETILKLGGQKKRLIIKAAGGASPLDTHGRFKIGEKNYTILRKILWKNNLLLAAEDVGGNQPRTLRLEMADGRTSIRSRGETKDL